MTRARSEAPENGARMKAAKDIREASMPHYTFHCQNCGKEFETVLHIADLDKGMVQCPHCGSKQVAQIAAAFSAVTSRKS